MGKCSTDYSEAANTCRSKGATDCTPMHVRVLLASKSLFRPISSTDFKRSLFLSGSTKIESVLPKLKLTSSTYKVERKAHFERSPTSKYHFDPDEEKFLRAKPYDSLANG